MSNSECRTALVEVMETPSIFFKGMEKTRCQSWLLIIDADKNKFAEKEEDLGKIINQIDAQLYGLF